MLALDEPTDADLVEEQGNYTFCIEKSLMEKIQSVTIDFTYMGFAVEPGVGLAGAAANCAGGCSGCGSH